MNRWVVVNIFQKLYATVWLNLNTKTNSGNLDNSFLETSLLWKFEDFTDFICDKSGQKGGGIKIKYKWTV